MNLKNAYNKHSQRLVPLFAVNVRCKCCTCYLVRYIESILADISNVCVVHDDIILTANSDDEHLNTLRRVLERCKKCGLHLMID